MEPVNSVFPVKMFIRHKARQKLVAFFRSSSEEAELDEALLNDVANTLLQPATSSQVYQPCRCRDEAIRIEEEVADSIAATYLRIRRQQSDPLIQQLNNLL